MQAHSRGELMSTGTLVLTFTNTHQGSNHYVGKYHFVLIRECDPNTILQTFQGELAYEEKKTYTIYDLKPGNYLLIGLELPDPKPGNKKNHNIMIYAGLETVYDVCYLKNTTLNG